MESQSELVGEEETLVDSSTMHVVRPLSIENITFSPTSAVRHCLTTGERCVIEEGPSWEDRRVGFWRYECPSCGAQHEEDFSFHAADRLKNKQRKIDLPMDIDMGELIRTHHIVARGLELRTLRGSVLHYDCVPAINLELQPDLDMQWGLGEVFDDVETNYRQSGGGTWGLNPDGSLHWGEKFLGNGIPTSATTLLVNFHQASRGLPEDSYSQSLLVNLLNGEASVRHH